MQTTENNSNPPEHGSSSQQSGPFERPFIRVPYYVYLGPKRGHELRELAI